MERPRRPRVGGNHHQPRPGIIAGLQLVDLVMHHIDPSVSAEPYLTDGDTAKPGDILVQLHGPARSLITGERTALNFLQRMSGIATLTSQSVPPPPTSASTSPRHPQNRTRAQSAGQIRGPGRWRHKPPHEPRRDGSAQGRDTGQAPAGSFRSASGRVQGKAHRTA